MAYPTDPSQVGLTVAKSELVVYTSHQTFTTDTDISGSAFTRGFTANGCLASGSDWWAYNVTGGPGGGNAFRLQNGAVVAGQNVEIGYDGTEIGIDPIGGSWDPTDYVSTVASSSGGIIDIEGFLIAYVREGPTIGQFYARWENGWIGPFFSADPLDHMDVFQTRNATNGFLLRHVRSEPQVAPGSEPASNRFFQIEDTLGPVSGTIDGCFVSWVGVAAMNAVPTINGIDITLINNTFDADVGDDTPIPEDSAASFTTRYENRWSDDNSLIPGDQSAPGGGDVSTFVAATSASGTLALTLPGTAITDDVMVVCVFSEDVQAVAGTTDNAAPDGTWEFGATNNGGSNRDMAVWVRAVTGSDTPGSTAFTFTGRGTNPAAIMQVYRDVDTSDIIQAIQASLTDPSGSSVVCTGVTTTEDNVMVVAFPATTGSATGLASVDGMNERADLGSAKRLGGYDIVKATAGATGNYTFTHDATQVGVGIVLALNNASAGTPPAAPANPAATAQSSSSILVEWDDVASETGYRVERSPNGTDTWVTVHDVGTPDEVDYTDTGLSPETEYFYRVVAYNESGDSDPTSVVSATTQAAPPSSGQSTMTVTGAPIATPGRLFKSGGA